MRRCEHGLSALIQKDIDTTKVKEFSRLFFKQNVL